MVDSCIVDRGGVDAALGLSGLGDRSSGSCRDLLTSGGLGAGGGGGGLGAGASGGGCVISGVGGKTGAVGSGIQIQRSFPTFHPAKSKFRSPSSRTGNDAMQRQRGESKGRRTFPLP